MSLISLLAISVLVSSRHSKSKLNIDVGISENRRHRILTLAKMILTFWVTMVMLLLALKQTLRVLLKISSPPHPQPLRFKSLSLKTPQTVPPTPGTTLQNKIESRLAKSLGSTFNIQLKQEMGGFQASMLESMNSLRDEILAFKKASESDVVQASMFCT